MTSKIKVDTIEEKTSANGVAIDSVTLKDGAVTATAASTITVTDNSDTLTLKSTDTDASAGPILKLSRDNNSAAASDVVGKIIFTAEDAGNNLTDYAEFLTQITDASDGSEDVRFIIKGMVGGNFRKLVDFNTGETSFNDDSDDVDFRVEGNGDANLLFIDAGNDKIGIGTNAPAKLLSLKKDGGGGAIGIDIHNQGTDNADDALITFETQGHRNFSLGIDRSESAFVITSEADGLGTPRITVDDAGEVGIGTTAPEQLLHVHAGDSGSSYSSDGADKLILEHSDSLRIDIRTPSANTAGIMFSDTTRNQGSISFSHSTNQMTFSSNAGSTNGLHVYEGAIGCDEAAPDISTGGLCLNQGADDDFIMTFKSSDVAHGMTDLGQTDTFVFFKKGSATQGGLELNCMAEDVIAAQIQGFASAVSTARNNDANAAVGVRSRLKSGTAWGGLSSNGNLFTVSNHNDARFIFDAEGDFHADSSSTTFDEYDDAQLARTFDITHGRGVIESKFDKFISYNHEKLAELELVGREDDGTPNHFINVTGMQRLHNGAIWQQYEKHQKLAEAVYEMAKEALGEDKADAILEKHDIKLLN